MKNNEEKSKITVNRRNNLINILVIALCIISACASVYIPKLLLNSRMNQNIDKVNVVPTEYYSGPSVAVVKSASRQLSAYQRLQLITNSWESNISPASTDECTISDYEAYILSSESILALYNAGLYPEKLSSEYQNWYTWKATPYKALDTTFGIYAAVYWEITYTRYDNTESHKVIIDENGVATGVAAGSQIRVTATALDKLGATKTVYISVQPHESDDVEKTIIQHGDCTETSTIVEYTCPDCGMRVREVIQPEHSWKHSGSKEKTCTEDGYDEYTCEVCGSVDKIVDKAPGHDYQDVAKEDATCTEPGHEAGRRCTRCGDIETGCEEIPKKGHDYQHVDETPATCTVDGCTEGNVCTRCGDVETGRTRIPAQGHKWSEWKVTKEATETTEGVKTRTCSKCGTKETDTIKKKEKSGGNSGSGSGNGNNSGNGKNGAKKYSNEWVDGKWYNADGTQTYTGTLQWKSDASGWWVEDTDGWYPTDSWQKIDGVWYYFKPSGYMAMGEYYGGYWFNKDGSWDDQYLLSWKSDSTGWWVEDKSGWWPQSSWLQIDGYWYYFKSDGYMATSQYVDGYLISSDGVCYQNN